MAVATTSAAIAQKIQQRALARKAFRVDSRGSDNDF